MDSAKPYLVLTLFGGAAFWLPDILLNWLPVSSGVVWGLLPFISPPVLFIVWRRCWHHPDFAKRSIGMPAALLLGVWFWGPPAMFIGLAASDTGGEFEGNGELLGVLAVWAMFPLTTFVMSAYSGSMGGLLLVTLVLLIAIIVASLQRLHSKINSR